MDGRPKIKTQGGICMRINQPVQDQLKVVQLKFNDLNALNNPKDSYSSNPPIQFFPKPNPQNNLAIDQKKRETLENKMLHYIIDKYETILTPKQRKLLGNYIEAYLLDLPFQSEPNGDEFHSIHQFVREAGSNILGKNVAKTSRTISCS